MAIHRPKNIRKDQIDWCDQRDQNGGIALEKLDTRDHTIPNGVAPCDLVGLGIDLDSDGTRGPQLDSRYSENAAPAAEV
jgi:hypothetical protein